MTSILDKIISTKKEEIASSKAVKSISDLENDIKYFKDRRLFISAIEDKVISKSIAIIAEIKKASPSKGIIRHDFEPAQIAKSYEAGGATCLSVLTDKVFFQGKPEYINVVKSNCKLPVLRKDFMIDPYQIFESKALGADCILLIVAALEINQMKELESIANELDMDVLVESHDEYELEKALQLNTKLIGINNRNLKTTLMLLKEIPTDRITVTESGIFTSEDISRMMQYGVYSFLVGEVFMRDKDPGHSLKTLLSI